MVPTLDVARDAVLTQSLRPIPIVLKQVFENAHVTSKRAARLTTTARKGVERNEVAIVFCMTATSGVRVPMQKRNVLWFEPVCALPIR